MPEEQIANPGTAADTISAGTVIQPATPPEASSAELTPEADSGFTAEDFKHPQYGSKAKHLYTGFQKKAEELKAARKKAEDYEALIRYSPQVNKAVKTWLREQQGLPPEEDSGMREEAVKPTSALDPNQALDAKLAFQSIYSSLGQGDQLKGEEIFDREYHPEIEKFLALSNSKDPKQVLKLAMEYISLKKGNNKPAPAPVIVPQTASSGERGGEAVTAPMKKPETAWEAAEQEAIRQGYPSLNAMFAAQNE